MDEKPFAMLLALRPLASDDEIKAACQNIDPDRIRELHQGLIEDQEKANKADVAAVQDIMAHAQSDHEFGNLPPHMGDFYDNEVRAHSIESPGERRLAEQIKIVERALQLLP
jgi:hypothetical protein